MNPITREESLLDGQDLTPITRKEQFIKRIYDKTQEIPEPITREEYFLKKAGEGTSPVTIEQLNATENGTYSEAGKAYSPVIVEVPAPTLITKTITENGTYNASEDNADGYSQVTVAVEGFKKKSIANTPTDIASFNDGTANPMPSLEISIVPVQSGSGDPSPSNVRPISGWSGANVTNISDVNAVKYFRGLMLGTYAFVEMSSLSWLKQSDGIFRTSVSRAYGTGNFNLLSSRYTTYTGEHSTTSNIQALVNSNGNGLYVNSGSATFFCADSAYTDETAFKNSLQGVYLLYQLANTTTPTITPTQFNTLLTAFGFNGYMIPISWQTEAGTVYGGTLNVTSGELRVTHANIASYNSETINEPWISSMDAYSAGATPTTGAQVVYPLATPQTYQLTPAQVTTLLGQNNIFADCGQILEGEYFVTL